MLAIVVQTHRTYHRHSELLLQALLTPPHGLHQADHIPGLVPVLHRLQPAVHKSFPPASGSPVPVVLQDGLEADTSKIRSGAGAAGDLLLIDAAQRRPVLLQHRVADDVSPLQQLSLHPLLRRNGPPELSRDHLFFEEEGRLVWGHDDPVVEAPSGTESLSPDHPSQHGVPNKGRERQGSGTPPCRRQSTTHCPFLLPRFVRLPGVLCLRDGSEFEHFNARLEQVDGVLCRVGQDEGGHREGGRGGRRGGVELCEKVSI